MIIKPSVPQPVLSAGLFGALVAAVGASVTDLWWGVPAALCAYAAGRGPGSGRNAAVALAVLLAAAVSTLALVPEWLGWATRFVLTVLCTTMLPWFAGRFLRQYRELVRAGWERAARLEREQRLLAEQARLRERTRIAQDMHDLLGHELSLIALSAGALQLAAGLPEVHRSAARDIRSRAGAAVERLGEVIGVLREPSDPQAGPGSGTATGIGGIEDLVDRAAGAGLDVRLRVEGAPAAGAPPRAVDRAAYRVVQEALTNIAKHAPASRATVLVRHTAAPADPADEAGAAGAADLAGRTEVAVTNGPVRPAASAGIPGAPGETDRLGLIGLDERVMLAGGTFTAGPDGDGFAVRAELPHRPGVAPPRPTGPGRTTGALPAEHRSARRRLRRTATAAVLVPLCTAAVLILGVRGWDTVTARRAVLAPQDHARLGVGQTRAEVAPYLPPRQTNRRPAVPAPGPAGAACEYYVQTADPFDDRSGDIYRLCFRAGRLVSTDTFTGKEVR
ncbi:sensor histidine kinase [Streptomyces virginiae]|uniref:sensor histidine kinase n=1 Tax=Streptomyces virginiae TaxID=1961 RepID=UPI0022595750|nr:histidine kinase [Streptomyces virginiae]MCX4721676.1 histidine kinase [Streptomyces virginiae]MCX5277007.1 histidine kinase [Streptomyces virginiae]